MESKQRDIDYGSIAVRDVQTILNAFFSHLRETIAENSKLLLFLIC